MPVSIAPSALAESLDEGWGDDEASDVTASAGPLSLPSLDESATALAAARVPAFDEQPVAAGKADAATKASKAIARASSAVAAAKARRAAAGTASATLTGGFFALPRAATESPNVRTDTRGPVAESPEIAPIVSVQASEPAAPSAPITTTETIEISISPSIQPAAMPSSVPPQVSDDDGDWELPSTRALAATAPTPTLAPQIVAPANATEPAPADTREEATKPEAIEGTAAKVPKLTSQRIGRSESPTGKASVSPKTPITPATKALGAERSEVARASIRPTATARRSSPPAQPSAPPIAVRDSALPSTLKKGSAAEDVDKVLASALPPENTPAPLASIKPSNAIQSDPLPTNAASADEGLEHFAPHNAIPAIDITIPPTFPHESVDPDALSPGSPSAAPKPSSPVSTAMEGTSHLRLVEPLSSMSPVSASSEVPRGRSKLWSVVVAAAAVVGLVWGFAGLKQSSRSEARKGQLDAVTVVAAPKPQEHAAAAKQPTATPEPSAQTVAAEPPPTGMQAEREAPPIAVDESTDKKKARRHYSAAAMPARNHAAPAASPETKAVDSSAQGEDSPNVNAAVSPQTGIIDPKAFPSNEGAAAAAKVRVEVDPPDSKIAVRGRLATAPYLFEVPKGARVVLEVARPGYITRRIVLDGSRDLVKIAMIPEPKTQDPTEDAPAPAPAPAPAQDNPHEP